MFSTVWAADTTQNKRIERRQSCYAQNADHVSNLLVPNVTGGD
jgi:hypothetical protein